MRSKRFVSLVVLVASLTTWSTPGYALREQQATEKKGGVLAGLEEALKSGNLDHAARQVGQQFTRLLQAPVPPTLVLSPDPAAGLEEVKEPGIRPQVSGLRSDLKTEALHLEPAFTTAGLEEGDLDELLEQAQLGEKLTRLEAIGRLGDFFSNVVIQKHKLVDFVGEDGFSKVRVLPDFTPVTAIGAVAIHKEELFGAGSKEAIDLASASRMRPSAERVLQIARRNWWNRSGEGLRDGVRVEAQIPPMEEPIVFDPGWETIETANDPVDGTTRTSQGKNGGISVFLVTPKYGRIVPDILRVEHVVYVSRHQADFSLKNDPFGKILQAIAQSEGRSASEYQVWALHKPYNMPVFEEAKKLGVKTRGYGDGTIQPPLYMAALPDEKIISAGRVGGTEGKLIAPALRNAVYQDGRRIWGKFRIVSENYGFEVKRAGSITIDGVEIDHYEVVLKDGKEKLPAPIGGIAKLSSKEILALSEVGYSGHEIKLIQDGDLEWGLDEFAPFAGDIFISYIGDPMTDVNNQPLYDWKGDVKGVQIAQDGKKTVQVDNLVFAADGATLIRHIYPDRGLGILEEQLYDQDRMIRSLRRLATEDSDQDIQIVARGALERFRSHALNLNLAYQASLGIAGFSGLEEAAQQPYIGVLPATSSAWLGGEDYRRFSIEFSQILGRINSERKRREAGMPPWRRPDGTPKSLYEEFDERFGELLLQVGDVRAFAHNFEDWVQFESLHRQQLLDAIRHLAQDPGAPYNEPPVSFYNPARFLYARLQREAIDQFVRRTVTPALDTIRRVIVGRNLADVHQKAEIVKVLRERVGDGRQARGPFQYEFFYDSLAEKDGEHYLVVQLLLDGAEDYRQGVVLELLVTIPKQSLEFQYHTPYDLGTFAVPGPSELFGMAKYNVGLLDPIHFINTRFPEWRPTAQRDVYDARLRALQEKRVKRQVIRPSVRQGNNPRFFEPFFRAYLADDVPLLEHIVHTRSEREYGNQTGVTAISNMAAAVVMRGGLGVTASWYLDAEASQKPALDEMIKEGRTLIYSHEMDHHRVDDIKDVKSFAANLEYLLLAYQEAVSTGWASSNLQDETKFINEKARGEFLQKVSDGSIGAELFKLLEETYNGTPVTAGLPSSLGFNFVRNLYLKRLVNSLGTAAGGVRYEDLYIEPDYALDGKPHTVEEMAYLSLMSWINAQVHGYKLSPVVPSYGNVHGASAGDPSLELAGVHQYAAQVATLYGEPLSEELLAIARKALRGYRELMGNIVAHFKNQTLANEVLGLVDQAEERSEEEERQLRGFVFSQLGQIPEQIMIGLKAAEREKKPLAEVAPEVARELDERITSLDLGRRAAITTHAASGLSAEQLVKARESGIWIANKSTEWQNVITKVLHIAYLMHADPEEGNKELARVPAAKAVWQSNPLTGETLEQTAHLYAQMYDAAAARAGKEVLEGRPFFWTWQEGLGWSQVDPDTNQERRDLEWVTGPHGRYMFSMRDDMAKKGEDGTLLFPNALTWGLPQAVIDMASAEIERSIRFYHQPKVMNAPGGAAEVREYLALAAAGLEEYEELLQRVRQKIGDDFRWGPLVEEAAALFKFSAGRSESPVVIKGNSRQANIYPHLAWPIALLRWLDTDRLGDPYTVYEEVVDDLIEAAALSAGIRPLSLALSNIYNAEGRRMDLFYKILALPEFERSRRINAVFEENPNLDVPITVEVYQRLVAKSQELGRWEEDDVELSGIRTFHPLQLSREEAAADVEELNRMFSLGSPILASEDGGAGLEETSQSQSPWALQSVRLAVARQWLRDHPQSPEWQLPTVTGYRDLLAKAGQGHRPSVDLAAEDLAALKAEMEKIQQLVRQLDTAGETSAPVRLKALRELMEFKRNGAIIPRVGPELPSYIHVHTTASYPDVPGVYSPTHMVLAADQAKATSILLVDHEAVHQIDEGLEAVKIVNEERMRRRADPLQVAFGVEFAAPVDPNSVLGKASRTVGRPDAAWMVGMGARLTSELAELVQQFQRAKQERAKRQVALLNQHLGIDLEIPEGNITDRQLAFAAARAKIGRPAPDMVLASAASEIRALLGPGGKADVPYSSDFGFMPHEQLAQRLKELGMIPTFTMQVSLRTLEELAPELQRMGMGAFDIAGIEPDEQDAAWRIQEVTALGTQRGFDVFGGSDYRGEGTGWREVAPWMAYARVRESFATAAALSNGHVGLEEKTGFVADPMAGLMLHSRIDAKTPFLIVAEGAERVIPLLNAGVAKRRILVLTSGLEEHTAVLALGIPGDQIFRVDLFPSWEAAREHVWKVARQWLEVLEGVRVSILQTTARSVQGLLAQLKERIPSPLQRIRPITQEEVEQAGKAVYGIGV